MTKDKIRKEIKTVEASARSFFGMPSEMDRAIEKWTNDGWELISTTPGRGDKYLLRFERELTPAIIAQKQREARNGCLGLLILTAICAGFYFVQRNNAERDATVTRTAVALMNEMRTSEASRSATKVAIMNEERTAEAILAATKEADELATSYAIATVATWTPTQTPTRTYTPTHTPTPTQTPIPTLTPTSPLGSRNNPYVGIGPITDGRLQINSIKRNMSAEVERMNFFNPEPDPDEEWVIVNLTFYCDLPSDRICYVSDIVFKLVGDLSIVYEPELFAVIENQFGGSLFGGGQITGNLGFIVRTNDQNFRLGVWELFGGRTYYTAP